MWVPLLVLGNLFSGGNLPVPSTTPAGMIHPDAGPIVEDGKADSADQPGTPPNPALGDFPPGIAVALQLQNNAWMETGEAQTVDQPDDSRQSTAIPAAGGNPAAAILTQICGAMPAAATMSGVLPGKKTTPDQAAFTDAQPVSGKPGSEQTAAVKTDEKKAAPAGAKEANGKLEDLFEKKTGISAHETGPALPDNGSRVRGAAPGNADKVQAFESAMAGRNGAVNAPENSPQGKAAAIPNAAAVNGGIAPEKMEIVIAAEQAEARNEAGGAPSGKLREGKTTDNVSVATPPPVAVEMRSAGERTPGASHERKIPSNEQIFNQVREKLDAGNQTSSDGRITLKLHPEELGELKISMQLKDQSLKVEIVTQNPTVKEALMQHIDTLKETLSRQNIAMERFDVSADPRQAFQQGGREERQTAQGNGRIDNVPRYSVDSGEDITALPSYSWENDNSLINLML